MLPHDSQLCLDPRLRVSNLMIPKCKVMNSKKKPLWLTFNNFDVYGKSCTLFSFFLLRGWIFFLLLSPLPVGEKIMVMFKSGKYTILCILKKIFSFNSWISPLSLPTPHLPPKGDDLRQDQMTLQIIRFVDALWIKNGLDLRMSPYRCVSTGNELGMLEIVTAANTIANIQKGSGGYAGKIFSFSSQFNDIELIRLYHIYIVDENYFYFFVLVMNPHHKLIIITLRCIWS